MKSRMPERARTDPWEPQGSNPLGPPGPELDKSGPSLRLSGWAGIDKPEAQAKAFSKSWNDLRLRFRLVSPVPADSDGKSGAPIQRCSIKSSEERSRVVPAPAWQKATFGRCTVRKRPCRYK